ncbi:DEAD/DEAH box helicase [Paenibacillus xylanexedens]|uniref:DEAD/DEAH box helicase n=1 Tax=Paenibacillus xylanexedens TaxID=528191 RepID=UPI0021B5A44F|nr:DEAD/DEAH box helicase [Paenibacillus xylanexedens]
MNPLVARVQTKERVDELLKKIKVIEIYSEFFKNTNSDFQKLTLDETKILIEVANILASSSDVEDMKIALQIVTTLPLIHTSKGVELSSFLILRKLGNYPAISLLQKKKEIVDYKAYLGGLATLEEFVRESINTRNFLGKEYLLTNFQKKVTDLANDNFGVSVSAPTSAGKSFVFLKILLDRVIEEPGSTAIYIVPTRALIRQVMNDILLHIKEFDLKGVNVSCSSETEVLIKNNERSNILVLTQERLYHLCADIDSSHNLKTKIIIIDEAQNIQSGGRGVLLENSIKFAQTLWPQAKIVFSSPLVENPEKLLETFEIANGIEEKEKFPLVRQNLIKVDVKADKLVIKTVFDEEELEIGSLDFAQDGTADYKLLADVALALWNNQTSIIYASEPMRSTDVIRAIAFNGGFQRLYNEKLDEFADFIEEYISNNYELANFIRRGLAFHFGSLPPIIRSGIEDLFKSGDLKIVSCTSTLLEGMNMPAKNIFVHKPEKGSNEPMDKLNFWNLAGRAGRMGNDFSGNIICLELEKWKENPFKGSREQYIIPSTEKRLKTESLEFKEFLLNNTSNPKSDDYNEQLVSVILNERIRGKKLQGSIYENESNVATLIEIDLIAESLIEDFRPPKELLQRIPGILPQKINELWVFFSNSDNLEELMPMYPVFSYGDSYKRFKKIIGLFGDFFENSNWNEAFVTKISINAYRWMLGNSLSSIIFYDKKSLTKKERSLTSLVKSQVEFLNNTIRYKIVKYMQVYTEVLKAYLIFVNKNDDAEKLVNLAAYLEYGACTVPALEFMAIGLPREAALLLSSNLGYREVYTAEICMDWLKILDVESLNTSVYMKKQITTVQNSI